MSSYLVKNIAQAIERSVSEFADRISVFYDIPKEDILKLWSPENSVSTSTSTSASTTSSPVSVSKRTVRKRVSKPAVVSSPTEKQKEPVEILYCPYRYTRKPRTGDICGVKARVGGTHCSKHKTYENKQAATKRLLPKPRQNTQNTQNTRNTENKPEEPEYRMRLNVKLDKWWHPETRLVFKGKGDITVIGHATDDGQLEDLTPEHIKAVQEWRFKLEEATPEDKPKEKNIPKKRNLIRKSTDKKEEDTNSNNPVDSDAENTKNAGNAEDSGSTGDISELQSVEQNIEDILHELVEDPKKGDEIPENLSLFDEQDYTDDEVEEESN